MFPVDLHYTKNHDWVRLEGDNIVSIGLTQHACEYLGDIIYIDLPELEEAVRRRTPCGEIESVTEVRALTSPVDGIIKEVNAALTDHPELINTDPYEEGWIVKVEAKNLSQLDRLMSSSQYQEYLAKLEEVEEELEEE